MKRAAIIALVSVAAAALALWLAYSHGVSTEKTRGDLAMTSLRGELVEASRKALQAYADQARLDQDQALADERLRLASEATVQTYFKTIDREVVRYVETNPDVRSCGLDADGLRIWNDANRGSAGHTPAPPAGE